MKTFGQIIRDARLAKGRTLQRVADGSRTQKGYVCALERGTVAPASPKIIRRLAKYLSLDFEELLAIAFIEKRPKLLRVRAIHDLTSRLLEEEEKTKAT